MIAINCKICSNHHFDHFKCSNCGEEFSGVYPKFYYGSASSKWFGKDIVYCPLCGHKFNKIKQEVGDTVCK